MVVARPRNQFLIRGLRPRIRPRAVALGIIAESELDPDTLEQRMRDETTAINSCVAAPAMIAAFARLRAA